MVCKNCEKEFTEKYSKFSNGEFCSKKCAHSYVGKLPKGTKIVHCVDCGKELEVDKRASEKVVKCKECNYKRQRKWNIQNKIVKNPIKDENYHCKICGLLKCERPDICKKYQLIPGLVKYFGFGENKLGTIEVYEEFDRIKNMLIEDYYDNELSIIEMSKKYNHNNFGNFSKLMTSLGIKFRDVSNGIKLAYKTGRNKVQLIKIYKHGYHTTWNGKQVFYRSSYELDYCLELDEQKIDYEMEKLRILYWDSQKLIQRVAIPDFYLPESNTIVEIKSDWTYDEQNMKDKLKAYKEHGYKFKMILEHKEINLD
jgi:DNA-directed RNA polymerase subunit RPC12/RpoP